MVIEVDFMFYMDVENVGVVGLVVVWVVVMFFYCNYWIYQNFQEEDSDEVCNGFKVVFY